MANAAYRTTVAVADPELARRRMQPESDDAEDKAKMTLSEKEQEEREEVAEMMACRKRYENDRKGKEREWTESFKMYMSFVDKVLNPFLSNMFIPKTHEAVELLAAFLIGSNQTVSATAENGASDTVKARVAGRYLDFLWRKVLKARIKTLVWIKQTIIFGNAIMKLGWDPQENKPWMSVCAIEDVYFDYFEADIQDSEYIFHEIRKDPEDVKSDPKYDLTDSQGVLIREQVICGGSPFQNAASALFSTFDGSLQRSENTGKVLIVEAWCKGEDGKPQKLKTLLPTQNGWRIARDADNPNRYKTDDGKPGEYFRPFVKSRMKVTPLTNRAYDISAIYPTIHIQKAFNDLMRQYFDSVQLVNAPMWKKRRGARINPSELVRRPGGVITMGDINKDLAPETIGDVKQSMIEMLNRLDREFQAASMISSLLLQFSDTATGDSLEQQPLQTLRDMINQNIVDALSEVGQMALTITLANKEGRASVVMYENEKETATLDFEIKAIDGFHDVRIVPDRNDMTSKLGQNKVMVDFTKLVATDQQTRAQYPSLMQKIYKRFLENGGVGDVDYFFSEENPQGAPDAMKAMEAMKAAMGASGPAAPTDTKPAAPVYPGAPAAVVS